jgi:pantoate--beta-alanine ligase
MTALISAIAEVRQAVGRARARSLTVGLVPTMGALHAGHVSLIRAARAGSGFVVVSIFVNPTQFGPGEDFSRYPRTLEADLDVCRRERVDLVFAPAADTLYPADFHTYVEVHDLQDVLCGPSRPGHFRGVATVVCKLFNIVQPDLAYFGQKDFQQARILQQLVRDLNLPLEVRICPTIREADGLALSSRNRYLNAEQRRYATVLYRSLLEVQAAVEKGERDPVVLQRRLAERIKVTPGAVLDYAEVRSAETLLAQPRLQGDVLVAVAVKFGGTRLIDNIILHVRV